MRETHLKSIKAIDTPSSPSSTDAGRIPVLGDDGHIANGFLDVDLEALGNNSTNGLLTRTGSGTVAARTLTSATTAALTIANGDGVSGNPTITVDQTLAALAAANWAANNIPIGTGADTLSQVAFAANTFPARASTGDLVAKTITDFGLSLVDDANAAAGRTTLGLGTAATQNTGTSGANLPFLNGTNTWGGTNLFQLDTDANYVLEVKNVDTGTTSAAVLRSTSDSAVVSLITHAAARTVSRCGQTLGDWAELLIGSTSSGLLIDTNGAAPMKFGTNNTLALTIDTSQNATFVGTVTASNLLSGTYTPTLTGVANVDSTTARVCQYMRVGNVVTVSGSMAVNATATTTTTVGVSLPVASNLANAFECAGTSGSSTAGSGFVSGDATNNRAQIAYLAGGFTSDEEIYFHFTYQII